MTIIFRLKDRRDLAYIQTGDPKGKPVFHFHGLHSSRLEAKLVEESMKKYHIRLISIDRAGMGLSSFQKDRKVLDTVADVCELADSLQINKFSVLGVSSGAKYALACAYEIPHRLETCHLIAGATPIEFLSKEMPFFNRFFIGLIQTFPSLIYPIYWFLYGRLSQGKSNSKAFLENILHVLDDVDKILLREEIPRKILLEAFQESYRQGTQGVATDTRFDILKNSWGFELTKIKFIPLYFWHGEKDKGVPLSMVQNMLKHLPQATLKTYPKEGHLSLISKHIEEIIQKL